MPSHRSDEARDYAFGDRVLALRKRAGLTQAAWAAALGASKRTIEGWEAGLTYPGVERLTAIVTLALDRSLFTPAREGEEAAALWDIPRQRASQRIPPFETRSFPALRSTAISVTSLPPAVAPVG